jgi:hypothetical protein
MSKILNELQFITQSAPITPNTTFGALFASGNALYFENTTGTLFPLGGSGGSSNGYIIVREYTGSNPGGGTLTYTWSNNSNIKYIQVVCVGAGGGGGGGAIGQLNTSTRLTGGSGGGGGAIAWRFLDKNDLTQSSYTISVGGGGAGAAPRAWANSTVSGFAGSAGQYTTFGETLVSASGGNGGGAGLTNGLDVLGGTGGSILNCLPGPAFAIAGGNGALAESDVNGPNATDFFATPLNPIGTAGGGSGYGIVLSAAVGFSGSLGASGYEWNTLKSNNTIDGNSGSANLVTATVLLHFTSSVPFTTTYGLGGGGNGVRTPLAFTIAGGDGGLYGAGGGGSGFIRGSAQSPTQRGGSGSSGLCIVVEYY